MRVIHSSWRLHSVVLVAAFSLLVSFPAEAQVIDNGLAPPTPQNVVDASDGPVFVEVHNGDCARVVPPELPCVGLGATAAQVVDGGVVRGLEVFDASRFEIAGGLVSEIVLRHSARLDMSAGTIAPDPLLPGFRDITDIELRDSSAIVLGGGQVEAVAQLFDRSTMTIDGATVRPAPRPDNPGSCPYVDPDDEVAGPVIDVHDDASLILERGRIEYWVLLCDRGRYVQSGGVVGEGGVSFADGTEAGAGAFVSGGVIEGRLMANGGATVSVSGGSIHALGAQAGGRVVVSGGAVGWLDTWTGGSISVEHGVVRGQTSASSGGLLSIRGGNFVVSSWFSEIFMARVDPRIGFSGTIELHGDEFTLDGEPVPFGSLLDRSGRLSGRLAGGERFFDLYLGPGRNVHLVPATPVFALHDMEDVTLTDPTHEVVGRGDAQVDVTGTSVRYLEYDEGARGVVRDARIEGNLVVDGSARVKVLDSSLSASLIARGKASVRVQGGSVESIVDAGGDSMVDLAEVRLASSPIVTDNGRLRLFRVSGDGSDVDVEVYGHGAVELIDQSARLVALRQGSTGVVGPGANVGSLLLLEEAVASVLGGSVLYCDGSGRSHLVIDGGHLGPSSSGTTTIETANLFQLTIRRGSVNRPVAILPGGTFAISGGELAGSLTLRGTARAAIRGGKILGSVAARDASHVAIDGGRIDAGLRAIHATASILVLGRDFAGDGVPVPFGVLASSSGRLTGILASGEPIDTPFDHRRPGALGTISVPEPAVDACAAAGSIGISSIAWIGSIRRRAALAIEGVMRDIESA